MNKNSNDYGISYSPFLRGWGSLINLKIIPTLISLIILLTSCEDTALFNAGDKVNKEILLTEKFTTIEIKEIFDIRLLNDTVNKVLVTCGENLLPEINIYIKDETLFLDENLKYKWSRNYDKIELELHLISTSYINVRKPCHIYTTDTFKSDNFNLVDWGKFTELDVCLDVNSLIIQVSSDDYGIYKLKGKANYTDFRGRGSIFVYGGDMEIQNCSVYHEGIGDFYLNVNQKLTVWLESSGNIYYKGNPVVSIKKQVSSGKAIPWDGK